MGPIDCPKTSVINYHYSLCNISEEYSSFTLHFVTSVPLQTILLHQFQDRTIDTSVENASLGRQSQIIHNYKNASEVGKLQHVSSL